MPTYKELIQQREALEMQIAAARKTEFSAAISQIQTIVAEFGLTEKDIFGNSKSAGKRPTGKVAPKYRNEATGEVWTGRGKAPKWIADQDREQFIIAAK